MCKNLFLTRFLKSRGGTVVAAFLLMLLFSCGAASIVEVQENGSEESTAEKTSSPPIVVGAGVGSVPSQEQKVGKGAQIRNLLISAEKGRTYLFNEMDYYTISYLSSKLDEDGNNINYTVLLPTLEDLSKELKAVRTVYETVLEMDPGNVQALLGLGNLSLMEALSDDSAIQKLESDLVLNPDMSGDEMRKIKKKIQIISKSKSLNIGAASTKFKSVLASEYSNSSAHLGLAMIFMLDKDFNSAKEKFDFIENNNLIPSRNRSIFYVWYGFLFELLGNKDAAVDIYSKAAFYREPYDFGEWAKQRMFTILFPPYSN